jgi:hypothetical protein
MQAKDKASTGAAPEHDRVRRAFSTQVIGWGFVGCAALLVGVMLYFVFLVLGSLTQPTPLLEDLLQHFAEAARTSGSEANRTSTAVHLAIILEYANADIRAAGVQVAFSLVAGLFFATIGVLLLAAETVGQIDLKGEVAGAGKLTLKTAAPGLVAIVLGAIIIGFGVTKDMSRPLQADVMQALRLNVSSREMAAPGPGPVEGAAPDQRTTE